MLSLFFYCYYQIAEIISLKEERPSLVHGFGPQLAGSVKFRPILGQRHLVRRVWQRETVPLMAARSRETEARAREDKPSKTHSPATHLLQLELTYQFQLPPNSPFNDEFIKGQSTD